MVECGGFGDGLRDGVDLKVELESLSGAESKHFYAAAPQDPHSSILALNWSQCARLDAIP